MNAPAASDPVDDLLAACLQSDDPAAAVARAASTHPEHAAALRARYDFLVAADAPGTGRTGAAGSRLGRFRLVEKIGGGGMGVVYRAHEDPPGREVALKLVRPEQLWFEGAQKRFLREVTTVAAMQHPGIVPVYSCGDHDGVPFCAMEYVRGRSLGDLLTALRRAHAPPAAAALRQDGARDWTDACFAIALQVAEALAHVHERGVVHRDVKPSNVMLDDAGRARLIDFGLASSRSNESLTRTGVQPGSLAYMSPEQVRGDEVDARTDVWSLGVTLHELLTLRQPFAGDTEEATRRAILAGVPPRAASSTSRVPWDAATVVATAMAPERERRYPTMAAFAADLRAILERRPIAARRAGPALRVRRWTQRHPAMAASIALLVVLLGVLPTVLLLREHAKNQEIAREAERARRETATSRRVIEFMEDLFYEADPSRARGATVPVRVILDRGAQRIRNELKDEPAVRAALLQAMGMVYLNLGLLAESEDLLAECVRMYEAENQNSTTLGEARTSLAQAIQGQGRVAEAERLLRAFLATSPEDPRVRAHALTELADSVWAQDRDDEALRLYDEALAILAPDRGRWANQVDDTRRSRAQLLLWRLDPALALRELRDLHRQMRRERREDDPKLLGITRDLAEAELENGDPAAAEATLRSVEAVVARVFDRSHPARARLHEDLAQVLMQRGQPASGLAELDQALAAYQATLPQPHKAIARSRNLESSLAYEAGDLARAERTARSALADFEQLYPRGSQDYAIALGNLARLLLLVGNFREAEELAGRSVAMHESFPRQRAEHLAFAKAYLAHAQMLTGALAAAEANAAAARELIARSSDLRARGHVQCYAAEVLVMAQKAAQALPLARMAEQDFVAFGSTQGADWAKYIQGWAQNELGKPKEAEAILRAALERQQQNHPPNHPIPAHTAGELGVAIARQDRYEEALELLQGSLAAMREHSGPDSPMLILPMLRAGRASAKLDRWADAATLGLEVLRVLQVNSVKGGRFSKPTIDLLLEALPRLGDREARQKGFVALRAGAAAVLAGDDAQLAAIDRAASAQR